MMLYGDLILPKLNQLCVRVISSSVLASFGILLGLTPELSVQSSTGELSPLVAVSFSTFATAQEATPEETKNYAKAGFEIEMLRRDIYQQIKAIVNQPPGDIVCDRQETLSSLKPEVRQLTEQFCSQTIEIVRQNNLSVDRYNQLKSYYDRRDDFYQQVQKILLNLQK